MSYTSNDDFGRSKCFNPLGDRAFFSSCCFHLEKCKINRQRRMRSWRSRQTEDLFVLRNAGNTCSLACLDWEVSSETFHHLLFEKDAIDEAPRCLHYCAYQRRPLELWFQSLRTNLGLRMVTSYTGATQTHHVKHVFSFHALDNSIVKFHSGSFHVCLNWMPAREESCFWLIEACTRRAVFWVLLSGVLSRGGSLKHTFCQLHFLEPLLVLFSDLH